MLHLATGTAAHQTRARGESRRIRGVSSLVLRRVDSTTRRWVSSPGSRRPERQLHGFTLIELLVVIAILSVLLAILTPSLNRAKELARQTICGSNLHHVGLGLMTYVAEKRGYIPMVADERVRHFLVTRRNVLYYSGLSR